MSEKQRAPTPPPKSPPLTQSTLEFMVSLSHSGTQGQQSSASNSSQAPLLLAGSQASRSSGTLVEDGLVLMQQQAQEPKGNIMYIQDANGSMIPVVADSGVFPTPYTQEQQQPSKDQLIFMPMNSPMLGEVSPPQYNMPHQQIQKKGIPVNKNPRISMSFVEQPSTYPYQRQQQQGASPKSPKTQQPLALMNASPTTRTPTSKRRNSFASSYMSAKPRSLASMICCCCKSKASRWGCVIFTVLLLVTVGVVVFLFFPRPPQFKVVSLMVANNTGRDPLNFKQNDPADRLNFTLSLDLTMDVSFYNDNRYDISVEEIDLSTYLTPNVTQLFNSGLGGTDNLKPTSSITGRKVGFGKRTNLLFPSYSTTNFTMAITLSYTPDPKTGLFGDITFSEFFQSCGLANTPRRPMRVDYRAEVILTTLSKLGFKPVFSDKVNINCPFSKDALEKIYSQLGLTLPASIE